MDTANLRDLRALAPAGEADRIRLFGEIGGLRGVDVPDPYYGDQSDFARVRAMLETGMSRLVALIQADPQIPNQSSLTNAAYSPPNTIPNSRWPTKPPRSRSPLPLPLPLPAPRSPLPLPRRPAPRLPGIWLALKL
jgi:hypothetical protein